MNITPVMYSDISGFSPFKYDLGDMIIIDLSLKENNTRAKKHDVFNFRFSSPIRISSILDPVDQNDNNKIIGVIVGVLAASAVISWYNAAGGLTYFGVSGLLSACVGAVIWIGVAAAVGYGVYLILNEILE